VTRIATETFYACPALTSITLPASVTEIDESGLDEDLQTINVPEGMTDHFKQILPEEYHEFIVE
jgi:hypothetical protein